MPIHKLRLVLRANAIFSMLSSIVLLTAPASIAQYLGVAQPAVLFYIGLALLLFAGTLFWYASRKEIIRQQVQFVILQDWLWIIGSVLIITMRAFGLSSIGYWVVAIVAVIVAVFAVLQRNYLAAIKKGH